MNDDILDSWGNMNLIAKAERLHRRREIKMADESKAADREMELRITEFDREWRRTHAYKYSVAEVNIMCRDMALAFASCEVEVYRKAIKLMIGRKRCVPCNEISGEDVDSYVEEARRLSTLKDAQILINPISVPSAESE